MPTPKQAAKRLKKVATKLATLGEPLVAEAASFSVERAVNAGGSFFKGRYVLIAELDKKGTRTRKGRSEALVLGSPPGFWAIKSYGRVGGYRSEPKRGSLVNLRSAPVDVPGRRRPATAFRYTEPGPLFGDNRWHEKVVDATADEYPALAQRAVDEAIGR